MDAGLKDNVVVITGASGGIGRACAEMFAAEGARLALHGHTHIESVEKLARKLSVDSLVVRGDLRTEIDAAKLFIETEDKFGRIDAVIANAGLWPPHAAPIHKMDLDQWNTTVGSNLTATFLCAREYFRYLDGARPQAASLVVIGSTAARFGEEGHADYAASKAGIAYGLTRTLKNEIVRLVPSGRVNCVCPGWTMTRMTQEALRQHDNVVPAMQTRAIKRVARPEDIASAVVFLSSERLAGHITGEVLTVSGGMEGRLLHDRESIDPTKA
jgi:NAD(P)-dependent dehydrogenase (short-subunit alcohol dehydrogenase family)